MSAPTARARREADRRRKRQNTRIYLARRVASATGVDTVTALQAMRYSPREGARRLSFSDWRALTAAVLAESRRP